MKVSPRTGRPKINNPKGKQLGVRFDDDGLRKLDKIAGYFDESWAECIRRAVDTLYSETNFEEMEDNDLAKMTKEKMISEMEQNGWTFDLPKNASYDEIKEEYDTMIDEYFNDSDLFPNGRDYDAEDEDGPF